MRAEIHFLVVYIQQHRMHRTICRAAGCGWRKRRPLPARIPAFSMTVLKRRSHPWSDARIADALAGLDGNPFDTCPAATIIAGEIPP